MDSLNWNAEPSLKSNIVLTSILMSASAIRMGVCLPEGIIAQQDGNIDSTCMGTISHASANRVANLHWKNIKCPPQEGQMCAVHAANNCQHMLGLSRGMLMKDKSTWYPCPSCILTNCDKPALSRDSKVPVLGCLIEEADHTLYWVRQKLVQMMDKVKKSKKSTEYQTLTKRVQGYQNRCKNRQSTHHGKLMSFPEMMAVYTKYYSKLEIQDPGSHSLIQKPDSSVDSIDLRSPNSSDIEV